MKKNSFLSTSLGAVIIGSIIFSCSEATKIEAEKQEAPIISDFSPKSGKAKTEIKVWGDNFGTVNKVMIGDVESGIKYKLTQDTIIIYPLSNSKTGKIKLINTYGETESTDVFTMEYPIPVLTSVPENGEAGKEIMIEGENLNVISEIKFGDVVAEITYQSDKEIVVKVPTNVPDNGKISFSYFNGENTISIESDDTFSPTKPDPVFNTLDITEANEGSAITFTGQNLTIIEKVLFGDMEGTITSREETKLTVTVPEVENDQTNLIVKATYYTDKKITITESFTIKDVKLYFYENVIIGPQDNSTGCVAFGAISGIPFTICDLKDTNLNESIHFISAWTSITIDNNKIKRLAFVDPSDATSKVSSYECGTAIGIITFKNAVRFCVLDNDDAKQKEYIDKVKNKTLNDIPTNIITDLEVKVDKKSVAYNNGAFDSYNRQVFNKGDVIIFNVETIGKIGFIHVTGLNSEKYESEDAGKAGEITFNCYFQK